MVSYPSVDGSARASYPTPYYAFSTGGVRFYVLDAAWGDTNQGSAAGGRCGAPCTGYQVDRDAHWARSSAEYRWLARDLAAHRGGLKFAFFHFPLYSDDVAQPSDRYLDNTPGSTGSLEELLHDNGVDLVLQRPRPRLPAQHRRPRRCHQLCDRRRRRSASQVGGHGCATTDAYAVGWFYSTGKGSACGAAARPASDAQVYQFLKVTVNGALVTVVPISARGRPFDVHVYNFAHDASHPSAPAQLPPPRAGRRHRPAPGRAPPTTSGQRYDVCPQRRTWPAVARRDELPRFRRRGRRGTYQVAARDLAGDPAPAPPPRSHADPRRPPAMNPLYPSGNNRNLFDRSAAVP